MLIGVDVSRADRAEKTGVEWYASYLTQALKQAEGHAAHQWLLYSPHTLSKELGAGPMNWHAATLSWSPTYLWTQVRLSFEMVQRKPDVLFVPAHVLPRVLPKRSVVTIHDVGFFRSPHLYPAWEQFWQPRMARDAVRRATHIITVSEYTKQEILHYCQITPERISVIYPGADHLAARPADASAVSSVIQRYRIPGPYFLYIGRLETKKNIVTLIEGFRRFKEDRGLGDPTALVLAGMSAEGYDKIKQALARAKLGTAVIQTGYVSQVDKAALLSGAIALVHPTWYEGFGLTPLEAMRVGTPVICARVAALPEIVGLDTAHWFDPKDPESLAQGLDKLVRDDALRAQLKEDGPKWAARYRWKDAAAQTLQVLTGGATR